MDTSRRNNVPPCKDDDDIWYWGYSIFVPHIPNTRAYPYVSRIMGPDPKYRFARKFLQYQWPPKTPKGRRFDAGGGTTKRHSRCLKNKENPCEVNPHRGIFLMAQ